MPNPNILYVLECRHVQPGKAGTIAIECLNCTPSMLKKVVDVHSFEWRAYCETCKYAKWCGLARTVAEWCANKHIRKNITHTMRVLYQENPDALKVQERIRIGNGTITPSGRRE